MSNVDRGTDRHESEWVRPRNTYIYSSIQGIGDDTGMNDIDRERCLTFTLLEGGGNTSERKGPPVGNNK